MTVDDFGKLDQSSSIRETYETSRLMTDKFVRETTQDFLDSLGDTESPLSTVVLDATSGGKRFRALCAQIGAAVIYSIREQQRAFQNPAQLLLDAGALPGIAQLSVALEQYQASALVHDDVIDRSDSRRGKPASHIQISNTHSERGLIGDHKDYGRDGAILAGDLLLAAADNSLAESIKDAPAELGWKVLKQYSRMAGEVALGQFRDMTGSYLDPHTQHIEPQEAIDAALAVVRVKSARYSVVHPTLLGALRTNANRTELETLSSILEPAGIAFQLRDDALGAFGEVTNTGKPVGIDISEGKRTVLLAVAWKNATPEEKQTLKLVYESANPSQNHIDAAASILRSRGNDEHETMILDLSNQATNNLMKADLPPAAKSLLRFLVEILTTRDS